MNCDGHLDLVLGFPSKCKCKCGKMCSMYIVKSWIQIDPNFDSVQNFGYFHITFYLEVSLGLVFKVKRVGNVKIR